ncbi:hypothetical protein JRO89_XS13G0189300 [Xanthoceras sorbifolium]|uniref:Uncharacterized protein n=1 Tax=Xanthoceras sorbifolium TaxID=99658 RepID=A0ABQ8H916_9ROSI|nr:hypothetical protein JRO89_XS13G0189300 [Xanthoceras sorbifolium]
MGNCQAIDAATVAVQHPCGKVDKFYWAVSASEIMRMNPDVMKGLLAKKHAKMTNKNIPESAEKKKKPEISVNEKPRRSSQLEKDNHQVMKHERHRPRTAPPSSTTNSSGASKSRIWQPSLQSISESAS